MAQVKMDWIPFPQEGEPRNYYQENQSKETRQSDEELVKEIFGIDSSVDEMEETDEEFDKWLESLSDMSEEDARKCVWEKAKTQMSEEDVKCCEMIMDILNNPKNNGKHTDLVFIENELKKEVKEINPLAVFEYLVILQGLKLIRLEQ